MLFHLDRCQNIKNYRQHKYPTSMVKYNANNYILHCIIYFTVNNPYEIKYINNPIRPNDGHRFFCTG